VSQALAEVDGMEWGMEAREVIDFIRAAKKRGICLANQRRGEAPADDED